MGAAVSGGAGGGGVDGSVRLLGENEQGGGGMRAAIYTTHGPSSVLRVVRVAMPVRRDPQQQLLIKVLAASINPVDVKLRAYEVSTSVLPLPKITGCDFCGQVVESSPPFAIGDRVFGLLPIIRTSSGSCAEFVVVDKSLVARVPSNVTSMEAASLPLVALTIIQGFKSISKYFSGSSNLQGKRLLITAGSGGLGTFAICYAKNVMHMHVIAICSSKNQGLCYSLGADVVLSYDQYHHHHHNQEQSSLPVPVLEQVQAQQQDVVIDCLSYLYRDRILASNSKVLAKNGFYLDIASSPNDLNRKFQDVLGLAIPEASIAYLANSLVRYQIPCKLGLTSFKYKLLFVKPNGFDMHTLAELLSPTLCSPNLSSSSSSSSSSSLTILIKPRVSTVYGLSHIREAHEHVERGHAVGKVVVCMVDEGEAT